MVLSEVPSDIQDEDGYTALYWAAFNHNIDIVDKLLKFGAHVKYTKSLSLDAASRCCTG